MKLEASVLEDVIYGRKSLSALKPKDIVVICQKPVQDVIDQLNDSSKSGLDIKLFDVVMTHQDMLCLSLALQSNTNLHTLYLTGCNFDAFSCGLLGRALSTNNTMFKLILSSNKGINDDGIYYLMAGLGSNKTLRSLRLRFCSYNYNSALKALKSMRYLCTLELDWKDDCIRDGENLFSYDAVCGIRNALYYHWSLRHLALGNNVLERNDEIHSFVGAVLNSSCAKLWCEYEGQSIKEVDNMLSFVKAMNPENSANGIEVDYEKYRRIKLSSYQIQIILRAGIDEFVRTLVYLQCLEEDKIENFKKNLKIFIVISHFRSFDWHSYESNCNSKVFKNDPDTINGEQKTFEAYFGEAKGYFLGADYNRGNNPVALRYERNRLLRYAEERIRERSHDISGGM